MKLVVEEPESDDLKRHLAPGRRLVTSSLALIEVSRATAIAHPGSEGSEKAALLLTECMLVDLSDGLLRRAAGLASRSVRTLDAIHLASALRVEPDEFLTYDHRLMAAAAEQGLDVVSPGE